MRRVGAGAVVLWTMTTADPLLLATARVSTFLGPLLQTNASGFFFERDGELYLVTSRHVVIDAPNKHLPDRIEIELHLDGVDLTRSTGFSIPLYANGKSVWRQGSRQRRRGGHRGAGARPHQAAAAMSCCARSRRRRSPGPTTASASVRRC